MVQDSGPGIRGARVSDASDVRQLIHDTIRLSYAGIYPPRAVEFFLEFHSEERILQRVALGSTLVAEVDGEMVATGSLVGGEILGVFVSPECQRRGLGTAVMLELEEMARARGYSEVELSISLPSLSFYEDLGYAVQEERSLDVGEGQRLDHWNATKSLL